jgi:hypothetical protein
MRASFGYIGQYNENQMLRLAPYFEVKQAKVHALRQLVGCLGLGLCRDIFRNYLRKDLEKVERVFLFFSFYLKLLFFRRTLIKNQL